MSLIVVSQTNGIGNIYFNRPETANSVNEEMVEELESVIDQFSCNSSLKVIIFRGNKEAFVTGGDIEQHQRMNGKEVYPLLKRTGSLLDKISQLDVITIAAVQGRTMGGGCEIVSSCDFCFASTSSTFQFIQARLGITTAWGGASRLMYKIGTKKGLHTLLTGEQMTGAEAKEIGFVDFLYSDEEFEKQLKKFTTKIIQLPHPVLQSYKQIGRLVEKGVPASELYPLEAKSCAECWDLEKHQKTMRFILSPLMKGKKK